MYYLLITQNAGYFQGCLLKRDRVPNPHRKNRYWHWSDFNNGVEVSFHGVAYRLCSCDRFTEQFLARQGVKLAPAEPVPEDPYLVVRCLQMQQQQQQQQSAAVCGGDDGRLVEELGLKKFLEFDGKVLRSVYNVLLDFLPFISWFWPEYYYVRKSLRLIAGPSAGGEIRGPYCSKASNYGCL